MKLTITTFFTALLLIPTINAAVCCYYGIPNCLKKERRFYALEGWAPEDAVNFDKRDVLERQGRVCCCWAQSVDKCLDICVSCRLAPTLKETSLIFVY
jgi:hypothetical protein